MMSNPINIMIHDELIFFSSSWGLLRIHGLDSTEIKNGLRTVGGENPGNSDAMQPI